MSYAGLPPLALSMGEPAGIGPDLILRLHAEREALRLPPFVVYGNVQFLVARAARLGISIAIEAMDPGEAVSSFDAVLPVVDIDGLVGDNPGSPTPVSAPTVIAAIERAVADTMHGACRGLVTGPIHKAVLYGAGFKYPGHTEFLAALAGGDGHPPVMMLAHGDLRVVPATVHVPIRAVSPLITTELITMTARTLAHDLRTRFGIAEPRLAIAGLNPHAGEGGGIGTEDVNIIGPAVVGLRTDGLNVTGPVPADTLFYPPHWRAYDAVIAMYHDQALIPIKTLAFEEAVNITLGLRFVRTSPDHGTAFDIAGTGAGSSASMLAAIRMADRLTGGPAA